jgi:hypothetical protein
MRLLVARCEVLYTGRLTARLPEAVRLLAQFLCFEDQRRQAPSRSHLMLFTLRPEDCLASGDWMKLAVGSAYLT